MNKKSDTTKNENTTITERTVEDYGTGMGDNETSLPRNEHLAEDADMLVTDEATIVQESGSTTVDDEVVVAEEATVSENIDDVSEIEGTTTNVDEAVITSPIEEQTK